MLFKKLLTRFAPMQLKPRIVLHARTRTWTFSVQNDHADQLAQTEEYAANITKNY